MRFYADSRSARFATTIFLAAFAAFGVAQLLHRRWIFGIITTFMGGFNAYAAWHRYWELPGVGTIRCKVPVRIFTFPLSSLRYAGPIRGKASALVSKNKYIELQIGPRPYRYVRIKERAAFLQQLRQAAPQAEIHILETHANSGFSR